MTVDSSAFAPAFHDGEVALQREAGVAERMARIGPQVIRDHMPEQHRQFFPLLPFVIVGSVDERGQPTASLLGAPPGFVSSPDPKTLRVDALPLPGDPLGPRLHEGAALGLLGIQPHTARRNRANGRVLARDGRGFSLAVLQSFGNCPKYIVRREAFYVGADALAGGEPRPHTAALPPTALPPTATATAETASSVPVERAVLGARERAIVAGADTFFLASAHPDAAGGVTRAHGVDVSHRGGPPGFAAFIDGDTFVIPDFPGNNFFNTLGNLRLNAAAGLLFIDVESGDVLQVEARAEVGVGTHPLAAPSLRARVVRFHVERARLFVSASGLRFGPARAADD